MLERIRGLWDRWQKLAEVRQMSDRDIVDIGVGRDELEDLTRMPADVPQRVAKVAAAHGLSEAQLMRNRAEYVEIIETCGHCGARRDCARALARGEDIEPGDFPFCPNAPEYRRRARAAAH